MGSDSTSERKAGRATAPLLLALVALVAGFAGCLGDGKGEAKGQTETPGRTLAETAAPMVAQPVLAEDGRDLRTGLVATDDVGAPAWQVGESWELMVLLDDGETLEYTTVMVEERADAYFLAAPDRAAAKEEAVWDLPIYGSIRKSDLATEAFGESWDWMYRFPLTEGRSWTAPVGFLDGEEVNFTASYAEAIGTPAGERPGFHIRGMTEEGELFLDYDFVPELGWFAHFWAYELDTEEPDDFEFHAMMMGHGVGWTGDYYVHEAHELIGLDGGVALDPDDPANSWLEPKPSDGFTVSEDAAFVYGYAYAWAFAGASEMLLVDPANEPHPHTALGAPEGQEGAFYDIPAIPGSWGVVNVNAGAAAGGGVYLWELHEEVGKL